MIKLFRQENSAQADAIEAEFRELLLGYDRLVIPEKDAEQMFGEKISLPVITNNEKIVSGQDIPAYLEELRQLMQDWQAFQGDSCYVNERGESC
ncbi:MAG TPA: hypothetical protein VK249_00050 [Anaerolineales bacterium]|nr:hypothetical protein [Anaerolineales bacterium]